MNIKDSALQVFQICEWILKNVAFNIFLTPFIRPLPLKGFGYPYLFQPRPFPCAESIIVES
jgi:hypothetical protein